MATSDDNKSIVRRYWAEGNRCGLGTVVDEFLDPSIVSHPPASVSPEPIRGVEAFRQFLARQFYSTFPDLQITIHDMVADGDRVGLRLTASGTQTGPLMGLPPTGRQVRFSGMEFFRIADGRIVEQWGEFDGVAILQQLGRLPSEAPEPTPAIAP